MANKRQLAKKKILSRREGTKTMCSSVRVDARDQSLNSVQELTERVSEQSQS